MIWCKFQLHRTKIDKLVQIYLEYLKIEIFPIFYKRSYQNRELRNAITFEQRLILTFCKKPLFPLMEIFQINQTWIF